MKGTIRALLKGEKEIDRLVMLGESKLRFTLAIDTARLLEISSKKENGETVGEAIIEFEYCDIGGK